MEAILVAGLASAAISAAITYFFVTHYRSQRIASSELGEDHVLDLRLRNEFERGKEAGRQEELAKFTFTYEPFTEKIEEYLGLKKRATLGYYLYIDYSGFRIASKSRCVTHESIEYDQKRIDELLSNTINGAIQQARINGMTAQKLTAGTKVA